MSLQNLKANKLRSFLTMLGIVVGIGSVIVIVSVGAGAQSLIVNQVTSVGSNLVGVLPGKSEKNSPPASIMGIKITTLTFSDAQALAQKNNVPHAVAVSPMVRGYEQISWKNHNNYFNFSGVTDKYIIVQNVAVAKGRFISENEALNMGKSLVLGSQVAEDLFQGQDPIGETVKIKGVSFQVVGVMEKKGSAGFENQDAQVFLPLATAQKMILGINYITVARIKIDDTKNIQPSINDIEALMRARHRIPGPDQDDFTVENSSQAIAALTTITDAIRYFLASIAAMSLVVGGIGIMNIMLVVVNERIKEIGLRQALGATKRDILNQFVLETTVVSLVGGIIGIAGGVSISVLVALIAKKLGYNWDLVISWQSLAVSTSISFLIGLIFGIYPAKKASRLSPMEALRYE